MIDLLVKNATLTDGRKVDIACAGGKIAEVSPAIAAVLAQGIRTKDIAGSQPANATTTQMGAAILGELKKLA